MKLNIKRLVCSARLRRQRGPAQGDCCDNCNYMREVELYNGARMPVCDGPQGALVEICPFDPPCGDYEPVVVNP